MKNKHAYATLNDWQPLTLACSGSINVNRAPTQKASVQRMRIMNCGERKYATMWSSHVMCCGGFTGGGGEALTAAARLSAAVDCCCVVGIDADDDDAAAVAADVLGSCEVLLLVLPAVTTFSSGIALTLADDADRSTSSS